MIVEVMVNQLIHLEQYMHTQVFRFAGKLLVGTRPKVPHKLTNKPVVNPVEPRKIRCDEGRLDDRCVRHEFSLVVDPAPALGAIAKPTFIRRTQGPLARSSEFEPPPPTLGPRRNADHRPKNRASAGKETSRIVFLLASPDLLRDPVVLNLFYTVGLHVELS